MSRLQDILIRIGANIRPLVDRLGDAENRVRRTAGSMRRSLTFLEAGFSSLNRQVFSLNSAIGTLGALVGGATITAIVKSALDAADAVGKMADRMGVSVEAAQEFSYAAGLSGVSAEKLESAIRRLNDAISRGRLPYRDAEQGLMDIADRFAAAGTQAERTRILTEAFGKSGADLAPLLKDGAAGVQAMREEARRLGLVLDTETVRSAEALGDELSRLFQVIQVNFQKGLLQALAGEGKTLADVYGDPAFRQGLREFGEFVGTSLRFVAENGDTIARALTAVAAASVAMRAGPVAGAAAGLAGYFSPEVLEWLREAGVAIGAINEASLSSAGIAKRIAEISTEIERLTPATAEGGGLAEWAQGEIEALEQHRAALEAELSRREGMLSHTSGPGAGIAGPLEFFTNDIRKAQLQSKMLVEGMDPIRRQMYEIAEAADLLGPAFELDPSAQQSWEKLDEALRRLQIDKAGEGLAEQIKTARFELDLLNNKTGEADRQAMQLLRSFGLLTEAFEIPPELKAQYEELVRLLGDIQAKTDKNAQATKALQLTLIQGFQGLADGLTSSLLRGENAFKSLGNVALNVIDRIISAMLQLAIVNPLLNSMFSLSGTDALPTRTFGQMFGGMFGGGREFGGPVRKGMAYIVGEKRPELFIPDQNGTIVPRLPNLSAAYGKSMAGDVHVSAPITFHVHNNAGSDVQVSQPQSRGGSMTEFDLYIDRRIDARVPTLIAGGGLDGPMGQAFGASRRPTRR